jgi:hypothetical protein
MNSNLCNYEDFLTKDYEEFCNLIGEQKKIHRKQWEFYVIYKKLLEYLGDFNYKKGLGFAVGQEVIVPLFLNLNADITATDLNTNDSDALAWINSNEHISNGFDKYVDSGYIKKDILNKCNFDFINMNNIPSKYLMNEYNFIWSSCALEHLGSLQNGLNYIINSLKCLKKGGIAVHTTEYNFKSNDNTLQTSGCVSYRKKDIEWLICEIEKLGYYIEPINFNRNDNIVNNYIDPFPYIGSTSAIFFDVNNYDILKSHINLNIEGHCSTSIYIVIQNI